MNSQRGPLLGSVAVIILTFNEEENISQALASVIGWAAEVWILDSFSTDRTFDIARSFNAEISQNKFENYGKQRNHALEQLPITSEWVLFLDADEWLPEAVKQEITATLTKCPPQNGFYINRRLIWMGRWVRRGYYPSWILRLFRHGKGRCDDRAVNEQIIVEGATAHLREDFMHEDRKSIGDWVVKHNRYATREALELVHAEAGAGADSINARFFGSQAERKRWLRRKVWNRMPPLVRPFFYFAYRYVLKGGVLDGRAGFVYHFLQGLWYPFLIDVKYLEMRERLKTVPTPASAAERKS
jgi:glycosyltransferase involved in cell wall biosynthesis